MPEYADEISTISAIFSMDRIPPPFIISLNSPTPVRLKPYTAYFSMLGIEYPCKMNASSIAVMILTSMDIFTSTLKAAKTSIATAGIIATIWILNAPEMVFNILRSVKTKVLYKDNTI